MTRLPESVKETIKDFYKSDLTIEINLESKECEDTVTLSWESNAYYDRNHERKQGGKRHLNIIAEETGLETLHERVTELAYGEYKEATNPKEVIENTEQLIEEANAEIKVK